MNTRLLRVQIPLPVAAPRGALLVELLVDAWQAIAGWLMPPRASVVERELAALRALAQRHAPTQPGFAADLLAAADRGALSQRQRADGAAALSACATSARSHG